MPTRSKQSLWPAASLALAVSRIPAGAAAGQPELAPPASRIVLPAAVVPSHYAISIEPDAEGRSFRGEVAINLAVCTRTDRIVLNAADLVIDHAALSGMPTAPAIAYDGQVQTATFRFPLDLAPGDYVLTLACHGRIYQQASGLFSLEYETSAGASGEWAKDDSHVCQPAGLRDSGMLRLGVVLVSYSFSLRLLGFMILKSAVEAVG